jgi:CelD/BcsL family acetyltransferase involved in cellulose biosynthesis/peptidoglycan/xylan/chitin deacetylase (PgdA/CDA1 family)
MKIDIVDNDEDFLSLGKRWNELLEKSESDTIFLTWEWISAWWKNYKSDGDRLFVLLAENKAGELLGIAPFYVREVRFAKLRFKCIFLIGDGSSDSDYLDLITVAGREEEVIRAFSSCLAQSADKWDLALLNEIPASSPTIALFASLSQSEGWLYRQNETLCAHTILPDSWDGYLKSLKPRFRTKVRSCIRNLEQNFEVRFSLCDRQRDLRPSLESLFQLHSRRWRLEYQDGVFESPQKRRFYMDMATAFLNRGWLCLYGVNLGDKIVASQIGFEYGRKMFHLQEGFDPDYENLSVGIALRAYVFRELIAKGVKEYDFLGGINWHKTCWGAIPKKSLGIVFGRPKLKNRLYCQLPVIVAANKEMVKQIIPRQIFEVRRKWLEKKQRNKYSEKDRLSLTTGFKTAFLRTLSNVIFYSGALTLLNLLAKRFEFQTSVREKVVYPFVKKRTTQDNQILIYHRVNNNNDPFFPSIPVEAFERQVRYLAKNFDIVSLEDLLNMSTERRREGNAIAITFDDGYRDNHSDAFPILRQFSIPAAVFLTADCVDRGDAPWFDKVSLAVKKTQQLYLDCHFATAKRYSLRSSSEKLTALNEILAGLRSLQDTRRLKEIERMKEKLKMEDNGELSDLMLTWEHIREMQRSDISFGSHTLTHPVLSKLSAERAEEEIYQSKKIIEERLGTPVNLFAYPFGKRHDFTAETKMMIKAAGYCCALTTIFGTNRINQDPFEWKRGGPWETHLPLFGLKMHWYRYASSQSTLRAFTF